MWVRRLIAPAAAALLGLCATAALAAAPSSTIVAFRSIGGAALGMSPATVADRLGPPTSTQKAGSRTSQLLYPDGLIVSFAVAKGSNQVVEIQANGKVHTAHGIGVGTTRAALHRAFPRLRCTSTGYCTVHRGRVTMAFDVGRRDRVVVVTISVPHRLA